MTTIQSTTTIMKRLQAVFIISLIILLFSSYASFYSIQRLIETSNLVTHTHNTLLEAENLISYAKDAETGQRGFLLTRNPVFLQPYNDAYNNINSTYDSLVSSTKDNPVQQKNLEEAKALIDERMAHLQKVIASVRTLETGNGTIVSDDKDLLVGKGLMDKLRQVINKIKIEENRLLDIRTKNQLKYVQYTPVVLGIASLIAILITVFAYMRIKNDLDQRLAEQKEAERKYIDTSKRISGIEKVTQSISEGNYEARAEEIHDDELGRIAKALNRMTSSLGENFYTLEKHNWIQTGSVLVADAMRGQKELQELGEDIIEVLATYTKAQSGTIYIANDHNRLSLTGSYAAINAPLFINIGEGLLGQTVKDGKMKFLKDFPSGYLPVSSSLGSTKPTHLLLTPLVHNEEIIGALELAYMDEATNDLRYTLLEKNMEAISIAITAAINNKKLHELLEETQSQAEELQMQHNELENMNTELEAQAQKLQASEEELRVQQEELQEINQELEERTRLLEEKNQLIIERNREVQQKAEELALSTKYKSEFLANMSHELRTPLNSILLLSRLLTENNDGNLTGEQIEYAQVIQSSGTGLLMLIDEILDLSKIEAGKMVLEYSATNLNLLTKDIRLLFDPIAREKKIDFNVHINTDVPSVIETDRMRLDQILKNLISNALKFTSKGSVSLLISKAESEGYLKCTVKDTGIGISPEKQKLIFEAFQQADGSTRRKFGGTGLGLSISRELARLLGGHIELTSQEGTGSEFTLIIPVEKTEDAAPAIAFNAFLKQEPVRSEIEGDIHLPETALSEEKYTTEHIPDNIPDDRNDITEDDKIILIVEDDISYAKVLLDYTRKKGYKGIVAVRGDEGIILAKQFKPLGILLDIQLPVKSGWEVMEELKTSMETRHIPVHIMSSHEVKKESLLKGAIDFINKPVALEQLQDIFQKLEYVLNQHPKKVLIVEENTKHAKALAYFLETFNIASEVKNNVDEGIDALKKEEVNCVILDMGIPDDTAYKTLDAIKKNQGLENLPIIIFTGKSLSRSEEQKIKQYADAIVVKTAHSYQRILDEVSLFLHLMEEHKKAGGKARRQLGTLNEVLEGKTVLIADDDVRNIFSLTKALEKMKMNVITAIDGKEAYKQLEDNKQVDIVLMDMMMPEMDGYTSIRKIREKPMWSRLPIIAVTAKAMTGDREKCINAGASDYITKPVDIDQLLSLLRVWLYDKS